MYIKQQYDKIDINKKEITIDGNETVVENINRLIAHIQNHKTLATKAKRHFATKQIKELNEILVNPIEITSSRPAQKTYPNINGLYLLLRTMGILRFKVSKKEIVMEINEELLKSWQSLNATEQYFMLLEFWLIHTTPRETIDAFNDRVVIELINFFTIERFALDETISELSYAPEYHNLALCEMFGFVDIFAMKPKEKNRWNIVDIKVKPLVKKILPLVIMKDKELISRLFNPPKLGFFQKIFQPYFKAFKNILEYPKETTTEGVYRLKISLGRVYRTIDMNSDTTLQSLAIDILEQFNFECDHLYEFRFADNFGKNRTVKHSSMSEEGEDDLWVDEYCLKNLPLKELESFVFIFDFGDWWEFDILIEKIDKGKKIDGVELVQSHGEAPEQYPDYDEEW